MAVFNELSVIVIIVTVVAVFTVFVIVVVLLAPNPHRVMYTILPFPTSTRCCTTLDGLQGACYEEVYVLTDPALHSTCMEYGLTGLGEKGMNRFFSGHTCGKWCNPAWSRARVERADESAARALEDSVPTAAPA